MVTLTNNELHFSFQANAGELDRLVQTKHTEVFRRIIAEDRRAAVTRLFAEDFGYRDMNAFERQSTIEGVLALPPEAIWKAIASAISPFLPVDWDGESTVGATISFMRTLRIPDDGKTYPLPPGLGSFPLQHVADYAQRIPANWSRHGGVMMPIYQSEALWLNFHGRFPVALKVGTGKINAVSGKVWRPWLSQDPQDYVVIPDQPWLDGYCVEKGFIRQFVAMPLGEGYTAEEQITGEAPHGGLQLQAFPLKASVYFRQTIEPRFPKSLLQLLPSIIPHERIITRCSRAIVPTPACAAPEMGLGAGGRMQQEVYKDLRPLTDWDLETTSRCFVHLCNSQVWSRITGTKPPYKPISAKEYNDRGLPWFDYYREDVPAVPGSRTLKNIKTVSDVAKEKGEELFDDDETVQPTIVIQYGKERRPDQVREWLEDFRGDERPNDSPNHD
jgi:hypothetical protein